MALRGSRYYNVDHLETKIKGAIRACARIGGDSKSSCTAWVRSFPANFSNHDKAAFALAQLWNVQSGVWQLTSYDWLSAYHLRAIMDFAKLMETSDYNYLIERTFEMDQGKLLKEGYLDEILAWGLTWLQAYDHLGNEKYLNSAQQILAEAWNYKNHACGGGIAVHKELLTSKNSGANLLLIQLAAGLSTRVTTGGGDYLEKALEIWNWFASSKLIESTGGYSEIKHSLDDSTCKATVVSSLFSADQGDAIGALVELTTATDDYSYVVQASKIANAVLRPESNWLRDGVLIEYSCEKVAKDKCWFGASHAKGLFVKHLGQLDRKLSDRPYKDWIQSQRSAINQPSRRNFLHQYGISWNGTFNRIDAGRQASALHLFNAASYP